MMKSNLEDALKGSIGKQTAQEFVESLYFYEQLGEVEMCDFVMEVWFELNFQEAEGREKINEAIRIFDPLKVKDTTALCFYTACDEERIRLDAQSMDRLLGLVKARLEQKHSPDEAHRLLFGE